MCVNFVVMHAELLRLQHQALELYAKDDLWNEIIVWMKLVFPLLQSDTILSVKRTAFCILIFVIWPFYDFSSYIFLGDVLWFNLLGYLFYVISSFDEIDSFIKGNSTKKKAFFFSDGNSEWRVKKIMAFHLIDPCSQYSFLNLSNEIPSLNS